MTSCLFWADLNSALLIFPPQVFSVLSFVVVRVSADLTCDAVLMLASGNHTCAFQRVKCVMCVCVCMNTFNLVFSQLKSL